MSDALRVTEALQEIIESSDSPSVTKRVFFARLKQGKLTRDDNPYSHLCVYFVAYDPKLKEVLNGIFRNRLENVSSSPHSSHRSKH